MEQFLQRSQAHAEHELRSQQLSPTINVMADQYTEQIRQAISELFPGGAITVHGPVRIRVNSEIYRARIGDANPKEVAVKRCLVAKTKLPDEKFAQAQYLAMERVNKALSGQYGAFRVPEPLFFDSDTATLGVEWVCADCLTDMLGNPPALLNATEWFTKVGAWLGNFHSAGPLRSSSFNREERFDNVADLLSSPLAHKVFKGGCDVLSVRLQSMERLPVQISWLHGDCKTDNFLIGKHWVFGIDIELNYENAVEYDIAQFLNHMELLCTRPKLFYLNFFLPWMENAFWHGYRQTGPAVSSHCLNWIRLWATLNLWRTMVAGQERSLRVARLDRVFARLAKRLSARLTEAY